MISLLGVAFVVLGAVTELSVCDSGCDARTPQQAVQNAPVGAKIVITGGTYRMEEPLRIERALTIEGRGWPVLEGAGGSDVIVITAADVRIEGLEVRDSGVSYLHELAAIRVEGTSGCRIIGNRLLNNAYGVYLGNAESCVVSGNEIQGAFRSESEAGNGIHSWQGRHHTIEGNRIRGHRDGIYLEFTNDSAIAQNDVRENIRYGLHFMTSHRNVYRQNRFEQNGAGVAVMYSRDVTMQSNVFANNRGTAAYGLLLKDIGAGDIRGNRFEDNTFGVYMEGTNRSTFSGNAFTHNGFGLRVFGDCDDNRFFHNTFQGNTFDVTTNSSRNPNRFEENYWSQYEGYDLNGDGIGDVPHRPVSLSSVLVERLDTTYVLMKSPLFLLLDQIEQAFPMLIPEPLKDDRPLMRPWVALP